MGSMMQTRRKRRSSVRVNVSQCKYSVVQECAEGMGWLVSRHDSPNNNNDNDNNKGRAWDLFWTDTSVSLQRVMKMRGFQKINHFPSMHLICRKGNLARSLSRMQREVPEDYSFFPKTWVLPADLADFKDEVMGQKAVLHRHKRRQGRTYYIVKPVSGCQGRGIFLTSSWKGAAKAGGVRHQRLQDHTVAQRYVTNPLLIDGFKFDLRIYVLVTSCDPLTVMIHRGGLVRLCTHKYRAPRENNLGNVRMHLTNFAINKGSTKFVRPSRPAETGDHDDGETSDVTQDGLECPSHPSAVSTTASTTTVPPEGVVDDFSHDLCDAACSQSKRGFGSRRNTSDGSPSTRKGAVPTSNLRNSCSNSERKDGVDEDNGSSWLAGGLTKGTGGVQWIQKEQQEHTGESLASTAKRGEVDGEFKPSKEEGRSSKRSLAWFFSWLKENGRDADALWREIAGVVVKTLISAQPALARAYRSCFCGEAGGFSSGCGRNLCAEQGRCFELLGYDILVDADLRPWLLEVNHSPSFARDTPLDNRIKRDVISDTMGVLNMRAGDNRRHREKEIARSKRRLYGGDCGNHSQTETERRTVPQPSSSLAQGQQLHRKNTQPSSGMVVDYQGLEEKVRSLCFSPRHVANEEKMVSTPPSQAAPSTTTTNGLAERTGRFELVYPVPAGEENSAQASLYARSLRASQALLDRTTRGTERVGTRYRFGSNIGEEFWVDDGAGGDGRGGSIRRRVPRDEDSFNPKVCRRRGEATQEEQEEHGRQAGRRGESGFNSSPGHACNVPLRFRDRLTHHRSNNVEWGLFRRRQRRREQAVRLRLRNRSTSKDCRERMETMLADSSNPRPVVKYQHGGEAVSCDDNKTLRVEETASESALICGNSPHAAVVGQFFSIHQAPAYEASSDTTSSRIPSRQRGDGTSRPTPAPMNPTATVQPSPALSPSFRHSRYEQQHEQEQEDSRLAFRSRPHQLMHNHGCTSKHYRTTPLNTAFIVDHDNNRTFPKYEGDGDTMIAIDRISGCHIAGSKCSRISSTFPSPPSIPNPAAVGTAPATGGTFTVGRAAAAYTLQRSKKESDHFARASEWIGGGAENCRMSARSACGAGVYAGGNGSSGAARRGVIDRAICDGLGQQFGHNQSLEEARGVMEPKTDDTERRYEYDNGSSAEQIPNKPPETPGAGRRLLKTRQPPSSERPAAVFQGAEPIEPTYGHLSELYSSAAGIMYSDTGCMQRGSRSYQVDDNYECQSCPNCARSRRHFGLPISKHIHPSRTIGDGCAVEKSPKKKRARGFRAFSSTRRRFSAQLETASADDERRCDSLHSTADESHKHSLAITSKPTAPNADVVGAISTPPSGHDRERQYAHLPTRGYGRMPISRRHAVQTGRKPVPNAPDTVTSSDDRKFRALRPAPPNHVSIVAMKGRVRTLAGERRAQAIVTCRTGRGTRWRKLRCGVLSGKREKVGSAAGTIRRCW